jgi:hypothetical protein
MKLAAKAGHGGNGSVQASTCTTLTIPAGYTGNQNPRAIVAERLYPHDLEATVLAKRIDPRVPAGYTVEEDGE